MKNTVYLSGYAFQALPLTKKVSEQT